MVERHPHVFGSVTVDGTEDVLTNWDAIKKKTKAQKTQTEVLQSVSKALPALMRSQKVQQKAAKVGFDFEDYRQVAMEVEEELGEVMEAAEKGTSEAVFEEFGDLMFSAVNLSRFFDVNVENALTNATEKFINRFEYIERTAERRGVNLKDMTIQEMDELWSEIKHLKDRDV